MTKRELNPMERCLADHRERYGQEATPEERRDYAVGIEATIPDDLPDGAYFAMLEEAGVDPEELIDDNEA